MSASISTHKLPSAIELKLRNVRLRHSLLAAAHALAIGGCVFIVLMILSIAIDWMFPFMNTSVRLFLTGGTLIATVLSVAIVGLGPIRNALRWNRAAVAVDDEIPQLQERWSTVASLSTRDHSSASPMSRAMAEQVTSEAVAMSQIVQPNRVTPPTSIRPSLMAAGASVLLLAGLTAMSPGQMRVLQMRFWSPTSSITATQLTSVTGDQFVPRGETIALVTRLDGLPRSSATLTLQDTEGIEQRIQLRPDEDAPGQFVHSMRVDESLTYRVRSGDGQTSVHRLEVIDFPEIAEVQFSIDFPEYTNRPTDHRDRIPRLIKVIQGSTLNLSLKPVEPLQRLSIALAAAERSSRVAQSEQAETGQSVQDLVADEEGWYRFRMPLLDDVLLRPTLWSTHGLKNQRRLFSRIEVIADKAPVARVVSPSDEMAVAVDETIEISFEAHDDHGIATAELVVYDESRTDADGNPKVVAVKQIPLGDQRLQKHVLGKTQLDLKELNLAEGSEISYAIRVTDNRNVPASEEPSGDAVPTAIAQQQDTARPSSTPHDAKPADIAESDADSSAADPAGSREPSDRSAKPEDRPGRESAQDSLATEMLALSEKASQESSTAGSKAAAQSRPENATAGDDQVTPSKATSAVTKLATDDSATPKSPSGAEPADESAVAENQDEPVRDNDDASNDPSSSETANAESLAGVPGDRKPDAEANLAAMRDRRRTEPATPEEGSRDNMSREDASPEAARQAKADEAEGDEKKTPATAKLAGDQQPPSDDAEQDESDPNRPRQTGGSSAVSSLANVSPRKSENETSQPRGKFSLKPQENRSGQNTLTGRRRLKITERLAAIAKAEERPGEDGQIRENVVAIDRMLAEVESGLRPLVDHEIADADRAEQFRRLDTGLGNVESYVADLREQTKDNQFAFVGLQMVDITRTHVTPARDRVFAAVQRPNASDADASVSLQHIVRARELLGALLKRYDRVAQEKKLERELDETVTMYEVYIEKRRMLMREARQNLNPLQRKMAVIEVDQEYLDRFAEVLRLRREMMEEFAQMLGDDPRLLSRYLELVKRRGKSLRDRLTEISERQYESTEEMMGWLQIDESQKPDLWTIIAELRLHSASELAEDAAELAERIKKQMPLEVDAQVGTPAEVIGRAEQIASIARTISFDADDLIAKAGQVTDRSSLLGHARSLVTNIERLSASLDRLQFENEGEAVADYLEPRMLETRTVADQADAWAILCESLADHSYAGLVKTEQHRLAVATQLLRVEMLNMKSELDGQFLQLTESEVPAEIVGMIQQLHRLMETITFNQVAASIRAGKERLDSAAQQQQLATDRLEEAEKLFDRIRRAVADTLDEYDVQDPNIADLRDPTLDEFLARLEREPSIAAQLGIPNRRRNLRVIADSMLWQQAGGGMLGSSGDAAAARARAAMKMSRAGKKKPEPEKQLSEEQQEKMPEAKQTQEMLEKSLLEIEKKRDDPTTPDSQRRRLGEMAENLKQMILQSDKEDSDGQTWQRIAQSDEAKRLLQALASGEAIPDGQWNKLLSTLDDGLWQVRGKQPPEAYRKAIEQYQDQIRGLMQTIDEG